MGVLMLKCQTTGRDFSTGIYADEETFNRLPNIVAAAACPHCGRLHNWWTREARVSEADDFADLIPPASEVLASARALEASQSAPCTPRALI